MKIVNATEVARDGTHGRFEIQIVTEDDLAAPSATAMTALIALAQADTVLWPGILPTAR